MNSKEPINGAEIRFNDLKINTDRVMVILNLRRFWQTHTRLK
jgi:hypothetical protein